MINHKKFTETREIPQFTAISDFQLSDFMQRVTSDGGGSRRRRMMKILAVVREAFPENSQ
jgi:hypothetical protein